MSSNLSILPAGLDELPSSEEMVVIRVHEHECDLKEEILEFPRD